MNAADLLLALMCSVVGGAVAAAMTAQAHRLRESLLRHRTRLRAAPDRSSPFLRVFLFADDSSSPDEVVFPGNRIIAVAGLAGSGGHVSFTTRQARDQANDAWLQVAPRDGRIVWQLRGRLDGAPHPLQDRIYARWSVAPALREVLEATDDEEEA
jgi:hypothetical protein